MDKELINVLSDLFDEKLKPIKEEIEELRKKQERIEKKSLLWKQIPKI